jgi:hypothetical protein
VGNKRNIKQEAPQSIKLASGPRIEPWTTNMLIVVPRKLGYKPVSSSGL